MHRVGGRLPSWARGSANEGQLPIASGRVYQRCRVAARVAAEVVGVHSDTPATERAIFERFAAASGLAVQPGSITQPDPPDILCTLSGVGPVAFELVRLDDDAELARMSAFLSVDDVWQQIAAALPASVRERITGAQVTLAFRAGQGERQRRALLERAAHRLAELPNQQAGPLFDSLPVGLMLAQVHRVGGSGVTVREVSASTAAPVDLSRIDAKLAKYPRGLGRYAELLAYAQWGMPFTDEHHDASDYLTARFPHATFARGWVFEVTSARVVACAPARCPTASPRPPVNAPPSRR